MDVFRMGKNLWAVRTFNTKEKRQLFRLIGKRERSAVYFMPDGRKIEQFTVTAQEVDKINEQIR